MLWKKSGARIGYRLCMRSTSLSYETFSNYSWADDFDNSLGLSLGVKQDPSFKDSVRDYIETLATYKGQN
jgi:hypothetical protein